MPETAALCAYGFRLQEGAWQAIRQRTRPGVFSLERMRCHDDFDTFWLKTAGAVCSAPGLRLPRRSALEKYYGRKQMDHARFWTENDGKKPTAGGRSFHAREELTIDYP